MTEASGIPRLAVVIGMLVNTTVALGVSPTDVRRGCGILPPSVSCASPARLAIAPASPATNVPAGVQAIQTSNVASAGGPLTSADVLRLTAEGVAEDEIVRAIRLRGSRLDLGSNELISLRERGLSKSILAAMLAGKTQQDAPSPAVVAPATPDPQLPEPSEPLVALEAPRATTVIARAPARSPVHTSGTTAFELSVFRGTRRLLISPNRIEYEAKDFQGRVQPDSFTAACDDLAERKPGRFERSLQLRLKTGRRYAFDVSKDVLVAVMAALTDACG